MAADPLRGKAGRASERVAGARVAALFEEHGRMVYGVCRLLLRGREEAEDATQETFLAAYRSMLAGTQPREPAAWLGTIARNECRTRIRSRMAAPLSLVSDAVEPGPDVEQLADRHEEVIALVGVLSELPQHQREAIVLREFYGLSHEEVGAALGVTPSAVDSLLVRARRRLQHELRPARLASGALVLPLALRESLAQAMPGFAPASAGVFAPILSLPIAAKLTASAATIVAVGVVAGSQPQAPVRSTRPPTPIAADVAPVAEKTSDVDAPLTEPILARPAANPAPTQKKDDEDERDAARSQVRDRSESNEDARDRREDSREPGAGSGVKEQDVDEADAFDAEEADEPEASEPTDTSQPQERDDPSELDEPDAGDG